MAETIEGTVTRTNGNGFQIAERDGWINVSKFAKPGEVPVPDLTARVRITLDKSGYARKIETLAAAVPPIAGGSESRAEYQAKAATAVDKDTLIVRQSSVKAAVDFCNHNDVLYSLDDLLTVAASIEAWVTR